MSGPKLAEDQKGEGLPTSWNTLDVAGLSDEQHDSISILVGGDMREVVKIGSQEFAELDPDSVRFIVSRWGDNLVLGFLTRIIAADPDKEVQVVIATEGAEGQPPYAYSFQARHQRQTMLDEAGDDLIWVDFDPRKDIPGGVTFLDWDDESVPGDLSIIQKYNLFKGNQIWTRVGPYNLSFHMGTDINT